jgi:riboflavin biosynthesis pyrimidine reductase
MQPTRIDRADTLDTDDLIAAYVAQVPTLRLNFVASIDGAATVEGRSAGLGTSADKKVFGILRQLCDGLIVGAGTVRDEHYGALRASDEQRAWRVAHDLRPHPRLVIVSSRLDLDPSSRVFVDAPVRPIVLTHESASEGQRHRLSEVADIVTCGGDQVDLRAAVGHLRDEYQLSQLLSEGGPHLFASLHAAGLVDELCLTLSPMLAGPGADRIIVGDRGPSEPATVPMRLHHAIAADSTLLLRYLRA